MPGEAHHTDATAAPHDAHEETPTQQPADHRVPDEQLSDQPTASPQPTTSPQAAASPQVTAAQVTAAQVTAAQQVPVAQATAELAPNRQAPAAQAPGQQASVAEAPGQQAPAAQASVAQASIQQTSAGQAPLAQAAVAGAPVAQAADQQVLPAPPPLPARWVDMRPVLAVGTALWFIAYVGLLVARYGYQSTTGIWLPTCLAGWTLGFVGTGVMYWQRAASKRGSRSAQHI